MFFNRTPVFLVDPAYLTLIFAATVVTSIFARYLRNFIGPVAVQKIVDYIDALGGLLRDVVVRDVPALLRPGQYGSLTLFAACGLYLLMTLKIGLLPTHAATGRAG